ncbi:MAG: acyl-CoA dehydratase activase-related protein, partial [bacterium]
HNRNHTLLCNELLDKTFLEHYNMANTLKIGIPRALFYYNYYPFCKNFFTGLGAEVIVSEKTNKDILQQGLKASINELCITIKLLYAHILNLSGKADYIFLPYIITLDTVSYICPKLIAAPDMVKCNFPHTSLLSVDIDMNNFYTSLLFSVKEISLKLGVNPLKIVALYKEAMALQRKFENYVHKGYFFEEALQKIESKKVAQLSKKEGITLAIIGHSYIINDAYITSDLIGKLMMRDATIVTSDMVSQKIINEEVSSLEKMPHWTLGNRVLGSALYYAHKKQIDGIIYVIPFGCSSDSLIKEYIEANIRGKKPFMTLTIDEHSGDTGQDIRVEAFLDMIERKNENRLL